MKRAVSPLGENIYKQPKENIDIRALFQRVQQKLLYGPKDPNYRIYPFKEAVESDIAAQPRCSATSLQTSDDRERKIKCAVPPLGGNIYKRPKKNIDRKLLFQLVKQQRSLYDPKDPNYKVYPVKEAVWRDIARKLGCSVDCTKKKWRYAREVYVKFLKNVDQVKLHGKRFRVWKYAKDLEFIKPYTTSLVTNNVTNSDELAYSGQKHPSNNVKTAPKPQVIDLSNNEDFSDNNEDLDEDEVDVTVSDLQPPRKSGVMITKDNGATSITAAPTESRNLNDLQLDDIDVIFIGYSKIIRKMPLKQQSSLRFKIAKLIMNAEKEIYN